MSCKDCIHLGEARSQASPSGYKPWCLHKYIEPVLNADIACPEYQRKKLTTIADHLRQMTDKELAEYMFSQGGCPFKTCPIYKSVEDMETDILKAENCRKCWLDHMQEEYKESGK